MPLATANNQIPMNPRGTSDVYTTDKTAGKPIGVIDYPYIGSFKILSGPDDANGNCTISKETKNNGDIWLCPNTLRSLQRISEKNRKRAGFFPSSANRSASNTLMYNYNFFSADASKPTRVPTNAPVSLDLCPMMAEICANSCRTGHKDDPQKGYRDPGGEDYVPPPHDNFYVVNWMDGHGEACPAEKDRFLNWQPLGEDDKYYAPYGPRSK